MAFRSKPDLFQRTYKTFQFEAKQRGNGFRVQKKRVSFCKSKSDLEKEKKKKKQNKTGDNKPKKQKKKKKEG